MGSAVIYYDAFLYHEDEEPPALPIEAAGLDADDPPDPEMLRLVDHEQTIFRAFEMLTGCDKPPFVSLAIGGAWVEFFVSNDHPAGPQQGKRSPRLSRTKLKALGGPELAVVLAALWKDREAYVDAWTESAIHLFEEGDR